MAEALAISAANLDIIEKNLNAVANELTGVVTNVNSVNKQVNNVEAKVESLNDEIKGLVKEIRETTIMTNARQCIMYNNEQIDKRFGYYDSVRRTTESLIGAIEKSNISKKSLLKLREEIILNNPNYWLTNALAAVISWLLNDKDNANKEMMNALKINNTKSSIFFCLVNLRFNRIQTSINWLNRYLQNQDPTNLDKDFVTILDLIASGIFGDAEKEIALNKIKQWLNLLANQKALKNKAIEIWEKYFDDNEDKKITMPTLDSYCTNTIVLKNNLGITSSYLNVLNNFKEITMKEYSHKDIDNVLNELIYNYEANENIYQNDNLKNNLIIQCNGNSEEAQKLYERQQQIYSEKVDLITLLTNISIYYQEYKVSNETQKLALALTKDYIKEALNHLNSRIYKGDINIKIDDFTTKTIDGKNREEINNDLENHLNNKYNDDNKDLIIKLIIINILGIIGIFITLKNRILSALIIAILIIGDIFLLFKLHKKTVFQEQLKRNEENKLLKYLEMVTAETIEYQNMITGDYIELENLNSFLDNLSENSFINSNNERNIRIGE